MKKLFTSLIMLMTLSMAAWADLSVGNVTVTSTGNVNPTGLTSGTIKYDASTNKLTLENVTFETSSTYAIRCTGSTKLTVIFKGKNTINATLGGLSCSGPDLEVYGEGIETKVKINSEDPHNGYFTPMSVYAKEMFIHDITLEATGHHYGINGGTAGSTPRQSTLKISNANVKSTISSTTTGDAAMAGFKACTLIGCEPTDGSYYDSAKCGFKAAEGDDFAKAVNIMFVEPYNLWILGKQVTSLNAANFTVEGLTSGTVSYDASTKTLTLDNVTLTAPEGNNSSAIFVGGGAGDVTIKFTGTTTDANLTANGDAITLYSNTTFTGTGNRVYIKSIKGSGIVTEDGINVLVDFPGYFGSQGAEYGFYGDYPDGDVLTLKKKSSDTYGYNFSGKKGSIYYLGKLVLDNMDFFHQDGTSFNTPGCYWDEADHQVEQNGGSLVTTPVSFKSIKEKLPIYICGKQLNRVENGTDVIEVGSPYITAGGAKAVCYDPATKTLTLDNATIDYQGSENDGAVKVDENAAVTITVEGTNTCSGNTNLYSTIWCRAGSNVTINGTGTLKAGGYQFGVYTWNGATAIIKGNVTVESTTDIGSNTRESPGKLVVGENAVVKAKRICNISSLTLNNGQAIVAPAGAQFKNNGVYVDSELAQNVVIMKTEKYPIFVCGDQVNSYNCNDILGDGKMKYDPSTKTLTLDNAAIDYQGTASNSAGIKVENAKVTIIVKGDNSITGNNNMFSALWLSGEDTDVTLAGDGKLSLSGSYSRCNAVYLSSATLRVGGNVTLEANGNERGIGYNASPRGTLIVGENAIVKASTISSLQTLTLNDNHEIVEPAGAEFKNNGVYVGNTLAQNVVIQKHVAEIYAITIAGTQVTSDNASDILGDGVFSYDAAKNILTINGDYTGDKSAISSYVDDLTIEVAGDCTFTATSRETIIYALNGLTFTGGNLTLASEAPDKDAIGIYVEHGTLYFKDAYVDVTGDGFQYAITGEAEVALVIESSNITASAHGEGCFKDFASMTLGGCYIDSPRGTVFENEALRDAEGNVIGGSSETETVVIKSGADAIEGIDAAAGQSDIYDVAGRKLGSMSRGINIVRSADGKTRKVLRK